MLSFGMANSGWRFFGNVFEHGFYVLWGFIGIRIRSLYCTQIIDLYKNNYQNLQKKSRVVFNHRFVDKYTKNDMQTF